MNRSRLTDLFVLLATGVSAVASSFAVYATSREFLVSSFNLIVLDYLPSWIVSGMIQNFGSDALWMSMVFSGGLLSVVLGAFAVGGYRLGKATDPEKGPIVGAGLATLLVFTPSFVIVQTPVAALLPAVVGGTLVTVLEQEILLQDEPDSQRRAVFKSLGAVLGFNVVTHAIGLVRREQTQRTEQQLQNQAVRVEAQQMVSEAREKEFDADGTKPLISETGEFYVVDINPQPPAIDADSWSLSITGLVDEELELGYDDLRSYEITNEYKAIRCLSDDLNGSKLDNAVWTGVRVGEILDDAGVNESHAMLYGADDYYYSMPVTLLEECLLAFGMNGLELPQRHGFPARMLVPNHWGKLHVKWISEIEIISSEQGGFWQDQGWHGMGEVNAVTKLDKINRLDDRIQLVGHAYAGDRGVETVEVSLDGGESWEPATLSERLPDPDTLRQWRYEIGADTEPAGEEYDIVVRMVAGNGDIQPEERTQPFPDGATGWIRRSVQP
jgi:DMSO/TMAO reductase YedYZ molybdopterin-dependent catalytic subunit